MNFLIFSQEKEKVRKDYLTAVHFRVGCFTAEILDEAESVELVLVPIHNTVVSIYYFMPIRKESNE